MRIIVIGAHGNVGRAAVEELSPRHEIIEIGRSSEPSVDLTDEASVERLFAETGTVDAVVCTVGSVPFKPWEELGRADHLAAVEGKVLSQTELVRVGMPHVRDGGSFTLTTGIVGREVIATGTAAALANGAVDAWVRSAAPELPRGVRLNAVSPTVLAVATGYHDAFPGFMPVESSVVGAAFRRSVEGIETGQVYTAG